jgi:hypothetical protein
MREPAMNHGKAVDPQHRSDSGSWVSHDMRHRYDAGSAGAHRTDRIVRRTTLIVAAVALLVVLAVFVMLFGINH